VRDGALLDLPEAGRALRLAALRAHNQELAAENERLAREAEALRTDPTAIERVARDELGWVRAGEVVVDLSGRSETGPQEPRQ
jgi:cell division protein FtsB